MSISSPFIKRPVATSLLTAAVAFAGILAYPLLPVSPLPQVEFPTISVQAQLPGASPETMAATVATPLERSLGRIAGVNEMTSSSSLGSAERYSGWVSIGAARSDTTTAWPSRSRRAAMALPMPPQRAAPVTSATLWARFVTTARSGRR